MTEGNGAGRIYWVGGSKGRVGKSMMTVATVDHLLEQGAHVLLVECDTSNPDVWKAYREQVETELVDLDEADGWIHLVNTCDRHREGVVVANTAARTTSRSSSTEARSTAAWRSSGASWWRCG
jgi:MinD superfamily P-loop ATPase